MDWLYINDRRCIGVTVTEESAQRPNTQSGRCPDKPIDSTERSETELAENALTGEQFGAQTDHEAHHGQTAIPGFSEVDEAEAAICGVSHGVW